jgi:hypothetical protein
MTIKPTLTLTTSDPTDDVLCEVEMLRSGYLRQQAETCLRLSQRSSNRAMAAELRVMAAEFFSKAVQVENDWLAASQGAGSEDAEQRP